MPTIIGDYNMKNIKIAVSRIYNARSWETGKENKLATRFKLADYDVTAIIGPDLKHPVWVQTVRFDKEEKRKKAINIPGPELYPAEHYAEIIASKLIAVDDKLYEEVKARDKIAVEKISKFLNKDIKKFGYALDFAAGFIGLKLDAGLVSSLIAEQSYIYYPESTRYNFSTATTINVIASITFDTANEIMKDWGKSASKKLLKQWEQVAKPFGWMLRGWGAEDKVLKFVSFFTAIEMVIPALPNSNENAWVTTRSKINNIIQVCADHNTDEMIKFLEKLNAPNSILDRFCDWAKNQDLPGWENDIIAFKRFSQMRNGLLHRGNDAIEFKVTINNKDVMALEDIAKRYVFSAAFES